MEILNLAITSFPERIRISNRKKFMLLPIFLCTHFTMGLLSTQPIQVFE